LGTGLLAVAVVTILSMRQLRIKEQLATEARERAEKTLALYEAEKKHSEEVTREYMADLIDVNRSFTINSEFVEALAKIDSAVKKDPSNKEAWAKKATTHYMMQQFEAATEGYLHTDRTGNLPRLAREFAALKTDADLLSGAQLAELVNRTDQPAMRDRLMMYDSSARTDRSEHLLVVKSLIQTLNPDWDPRGFEYNPTTRSLALSGPGLMVLTTGPNTAKSALRTLNLRALDLHGSGFFNLQDIMVLNIETLDIRQTKVVNLELLKNMKYLKKLIVSPDRFPESQLEEVRREIEVVVE
jgi:tetratricopeptide (TPR) repeat protein